MLVRASWCWRWLFHCGPVRGPLILGRSFVLAVFTVLGRWLRYRRSYRRSYRLRYWLRYRLRYWLRYRRCYGWQRMTPARRAIPRMSHAIPPHCVAPRNHIVGIATFADAVESSPNRIACETAPSALAACVPRRARGPDTSRVGPTLRAWARWYAPGSDTSCVGLMVCVGDAQAHILGLACVSWG